MTGVPVGLMFHRFRPSGGENGEQGAHSPEELERILRFVGVENILAPAEWLERVKKNRLQPSDRCITFDDGLRSQAEHALPVLEAHGLKAFWFVYSSVHEGKPVKSEIYSAAAGILGGMGALIERFLASCPAKISSALRTPAYAEYAARMRQAAPFYSDDDLKFRFLRNDPAHRVEFESAMDGLLARSGISTAEIAGKLWLNGEDLGQLAGEGHVIGLHSYDHPYAMADLGREEQRDQYERNRAHLSRVTGKKIESVSYPLNSYNRDSIEVLREMGVYCGFRANTLPPAFPDPELYSMQLPREDSSILLAAATGRG